MMYTLLTFHGFEFIWYFVQGVQNRGSSSTQPQGVVPFPRHQNPMMCTSCVFLPASLAALIFSLPLFLWLLFLQIAVTPCPILSSLLSLLGWLVTHTLNSIWRWRQSQRYITVTGWREKNKIHLCHCSVISRAVDDWKSLIGKQALLANLLTSDWSESARKASLLSLPPTTQLRWECVKLWLSPNSVVEVAMVNDWYQIHHKDKIVITC